jgi:hypothetical protein
MADKGKGPRRPSVILGQFAFGLERGKGSLLSGAFSRRRRILSTLRSSSSRRRSESEAAFGRICLINGGKARGEAAGAGSGGSADGARRGAESVSSRGVCEGNPYTFGSDGSALGGPA